MSRIITFRPLAQAYYQARSLVLAGAGALGLDHTVLGGTILSWASAWDYALGTSSDAILDGPSGNRKWSALAGVWHTVIASTGLDFPSANCLRLQVTAATGSYGRVVAAGLPVPSVGGSLWLRWYFRAAFEDGHSDSHNHPIEGAAGILASAQNWAMRCWTNHVGGTVWYPQFFFPGDDTAWTGPDLAKHATYRVELQLKRTGAATAEVHVRIYDDADVLVADDADFANGAATLADVPTIDMTSIPNWQYMNAGVEGDTGAFEGMLLYYEGCFAASVTDWCGPYQEGEGG